MDAGQFLAVELITEPRSVLVADFASERDRFGDDVIRGEQVLDEPQVLESSEDFDDARMGASLFETSAKRNPVSRKITPSAGRKGSGRVARPCRRARPR